MHSEGQGVFQLMEPFCFHWMINFLLLTLSLFTMTPFGAPHSSKSPSLHGIPGLFLILHISKSVYLNSVLISALSQEYSDLCIFLFCHETLFLERSVSVFNTARTYDVDFGENSTVFPHLFLILCLNYAFKELMGQRRNQNWKLV